jgi:beta-glucanase (GH16 family)
VNRYRDKDSDGAEPFCFKPDAGRRGCGWLVLPPVVALSAACGTNSTVSADSRPAVSAPAGPGVSAISEPGGLPAGYRLVWSDEFDRDGLPDPGRWSYDISRNAVGWANHELQYYAKGRPENSRVASGNLVIEARREELAPAQFPDWGGQHYTSARLVTRGHASWTYGFFEARARLPCGRGTWPALWLLSALPQAPWPAAGEIDFMEQVGFDPAAIHGTVHDAEFNGALGNQRTATTTAADACSNFHRYQLTWTPQRITVGMDDHNYYQYANDGSGSGEWPFDKPQFMIVNLAVGGDWGGQHGVDDSAFPARMEIDYVRVYQR